MPVRPGTHKPSPATTERHGTADRAGRYSDLYTTRKWRRLRAAHLTSHPLCELCRADGLVTVGNIVHHRIPHRGDMALFWDVNNLETLCKAHHDSDKQRAEKSGRARRVIGVDGIPR